MRLSSITPPAIGLLVEFALDAAEPLFVMSGLAAGCFRVWAILTHKPVDMIRRWTAIGSAVGAGLMILFVLVDLLVEGG